MSKHTIQPIPQPSIQRLVAGQAISDLTSAVKELVENAIDAGASRVCIKLYDQGLTTIQVTDNGTGVPFACRDLMAAKHATSKLRTFGDLYGNTSDDGNGGDGNANTSANLAGSNTQSTSTVSTLGFRGEALFSLANISKSMVVSTRTSDENAGEEFSFDPQGNLITETRRTVARGVGTTVTVHGLFERLPVRRVDLCKRIKTQRMKLIKVLQGYAILCLGTQFNLVDVKTNAKSKSKSAVKSAEVVRLATCDSSTTATLQSRSASIFGTKFLDGLSSIEIDLFSAVKEEKPYFWKVQCLVSHSPSSPYPATARDNQFFSVNGRPVELPSVSRVIGDVWRRFDPSETGRRPACIIAFTLPNRAFDVNLSPDKRQVLLTEESAILELIRKGLMEFWTGQSEGKFVANEAETRMQSNAKGSPSDAETTDDPEKNIIGTLNTNATGSEQVNTVTPRPRRVKSDEASSESLPLNKLSLCVMDKTVITPNITQTQPEASHTTSTDSTTAELHEHTEIDEALSTNIDDLNKFHVKPDTVKKRDRQVWEQMKLSFNGLNKYEKREVRSRMLRLDVDVATDKRDEGTHAKLDPNDMAVKTEISSKSTPSTKLSATHALLAYKEGEETIGTESTLNRIAFGPSNYKNEVKTRSELSTAAEPSLEENCVSGGRQQSMLLETDRVFCRRIISRRDHLNPFLNGFAAELSKPGKRDAKVDGKCEEFHSTESSKPKKLNSSSHCDSSTDDELAHGNGGFIYRKRVISQKRIRPLQGRARERDSLDATSSTVRDRSRRQASRDVFDAKACRQREHHPKRVHYETTWTSFAGSQSVIAQSQQSLVFMRKKRKLFRSSLKHENDRSDLRHSISEASSINQVNLCKEDFSHMSLIGQFNLGFILVRCRNHNLWILDQHACDEKYNFERFCKQTRIHEQKLITPLPLELSPSEQHCILEHMDLFETNGFRFDYNPEHDPRSRLSLTALPHSGSGGDGTKAVQFGKEDVWALCAMLGAEGTASSDGYVAGYGTGADGSGFGSSNAVKRLAGVTSGNRNVNSVTGPYVVRLPKAIAMFASRACRKSIMIGTALSYKEQLQILKKLEKTDVPWNCAHGRPTISHIRGLAECLQDDDSVAYHYFTGPCVSML